MHTQYCKKRGLPRVLQRADGILLKPHRPSGSTERSAITETVSPQSGVPARRDHATDRCAAAHLCHLPPTPTRPPCRLPPAGPAPSPRPCHADARALSRAERDGPARAGHAGQRVIVARNAARAGVCRAAYRRVRLPDGERGARVPALQDLRPTACCPRVLRGRPGSTTAPRHAVRRAPAGGYVVCLDAGHQRRADSARNRSRPAPLR